MSLVVLPFLWRCMLSLARLPPERPPFSSRLHVLFCHRPRASLRRRRHLHNVRILSLFFHTLLTLCPLSLYGVTLAQFFFYLFNFHQDGLLFKSFVRLPPPSYVPLTPSSPLLLRSSSSGPSYPPSPSRTTLTCLPSCLDTAGSMFNVQVRLRYQSSPILTRALTSYAFPVPLVLPDQEPREPPTCNLCPSVSLPFVV